MNYELRPYQTAAAKHAIEFLRNAETGDRQLYAAPTGSGKSFIQIAVQWAIPDSWIVTSRREIIAGLIAKGADADRCVTPITFRNAMLAGTAAPPRALILDEAHHDCAQSWRDIHALAGYCPAVAYTATPFRGTPAGTAEFKRIWGEPVWIITLKDAVDQGYISMPSCRVVPLIDDDVVEVVNGELSASQVTSETLSRLDDIVAMSPETWDVPAMYACPGQEVARELMSRLRDSGRPAAVITQDTPPRVRAEVFRLLLDCRIALCQIQVVSEGVDLPIRRLIDLAPTLSPVKWMQQFGRITRPGGHPEYICTNRNFLRHSYLIAGCLPPATIVAAQKMFPVSERIGHRAVGLEAIGRLRGNPVALKSGMTATTYFLSAVEGNLVTQYCAILHPTKEMPIWARRVNERVDGVTETYGRWRRCDSPGDLTGFASLPAGKVTEKMQAWWDRSAASRGLDSAVEPSRRTFQLLPVLFDIGARL